MDKKKLDYYMEDLHKARWERDQAYSAYKKFDERYQLERLKLEEAIRSAGLKTISNKNFTATITERHKIVIDHEPSVIEWLKDNPQLEPDLYIGLKKTAFDTIASIAMVKNGEVIPGAHVETSESVTLKKKNKEDNYGTDTE